jgi:hypothetical protein
MVKHVVTVWQDHFGAFGQATGWHDRAPRNAMPSMGTTWTVLWCGLVATFMPGCAGPGPLVEHRAGCAAVIRQSPFNGTFTLYSDCGRVVSTTSLAGDEVGFAKLGEQLLAVNGPERWPLCEAKYRWVRETYDQPWFAFLSRPSTNSARPVMPAEMVKAIVVSLDRAAARWK